jgi:hypothetical protein
VLCRTLHASLDVFVRQLKRGVVNGNAFARGQNAMGFAGFRRRDVSPGEINECISERPVAIEQSARGEMRTPRVWPSARRWDLSGGNAVSARAAPVRSRSGAGTGNFRDHDRGPRPHGDDGRPPGDRPGRGRPLAADTKPPGPSGTMIVGECMSLRTHHHCVSCSCGATGAASPVAGWRE